MANPPSDYLSVYKTFFEEFAATVSPDDQLPVKVGGYSVAESEVVGEIVDWILQYLCQKRCPSNLVATLTQIVLKEIRLAIKKQPHAFGFRREDNAYQPLKLMQLVTSKVNDVCLGYLKPECLQSLSPPNACQLVSACAVKNSRRRMEDRHTIIDDFHSIFDIADQGLANYYAVFDGHAGTDAAVYGVSHLHQFLAESQYYPSDPERALRDAFQRTDDMFLEKSNRENLRSGTTALCALIRHKERMLHVAWLGDSQALLVRRGIPTQLVNPHKPDRQDERERIEGMGGCVMYWGTWRVNGQLAVSRAIGDLEYKPYVTASPDIQSVPLEDDQDFLILACDGLWDYVSEQEAVVKVYQTIRERPGDLEAVSQGLVQLSKQQGSVDNISVIVVFLTDPARLAAMDVWPKLEDADATCDPTANNPFTNGGGDEPTWDQKTPGSNNLLLDLGLGLGSKLSAAVPSETDLYFLNRPAKNGRGDQEDDDEDFGPETDVDAVDDVLLSPAIAAAKALESQQMQKLQQQLDAFDDPCQVESRDTPTPPADDVSPGPALLPESENVAESGEESEDEWNYYRVEPAEKSEPQPPAKTAAQTREEEEAEMESRLNPNAAEFVPSPTSTKPSMEELIAASPHKGGGTPMDDVQIPSPIEFQEEVCLRPSELGHNPFSPCEISESLLPDLLNRKTELNSNEKNPYQILENASDFGELSEPVNPLMSSDVLFDKSEVSSTKAEFGDETAASFLANMSDGEYLLNAANANTSECPDLDSSMTEADFAAANLPQETSGDDMISKVENTFISPIDVCEQNVCFELQKEFEPLVESEDYRVPVYMGNENVDMEINSTPLNEELGLVSSIAPTNLDFTSDLANLVETSVGDLVSELLPVTSFSNSALSPSKDMSDFVLDFTEEVKEVVLAPMFSPTPSPSDVQVSSVTSGIQNIDLDTNISGLVQLDTEFTAPEPVVSAASEFIKFDTEMQVSNQPTEPEERDLPPMLPTKDYAVLEESAKEAMIESQPKESVAVASEEPVNISAKDNKEHDDCSTAVADESGLLSGISAQPAAVIAAASVATAAVVGKVLSASETPDTKEVAKKPVADKVKPSTKTSLGSKVGTAPQKSQPKATPTSPTKPLTPSTRSTPPKKPAAATTTRAMSKTTTTTTTTKVSAPSKPAPSSSVTSKVTATSTSQVRVKVGSSPTKPSPAVKQAPAKTAAPPKPRPMPSAAARAPLTEKKPGVTNGDAKLPIKRPDTLATKKLVPSTTAKPLPRPSTAPAASKSTTRSVPSARTTSVSTAASKTTTKPAVNGVSKPKTTTTTTTLRAKPLSATSKPGTTDKQVKDTANKQISSVGTKSSTLSRTATTTATARKPGVGVTKTTTSTTVTKVSSITGKKPSATTVTKTSEIITVTPSEVVVVEGFTSTVTKDDSPITDNAQIEVISSTD